MFKTLKEAQSWIEAIQKFGSKYDLSRMEKAIELLGHPEKSYPTIHIGGTNGKGSTLSYLSHILDAAGYKVGSFISPYVIKINERFQINQVMISDDDLLKYTNQMYDFYHEFDSITHDHLTFFELMTLIGFLYFRDQKVDIAVIEVGLGGRLDATNVIHPLVSVITSIGYDHMHILGNTLELISLEKLGIVKPGTPLISGVLNPELVPLFKAKAEENKAEISFISPLKFTPTRPQGFEFLEDTFYISMLGSHQIQNAKCAILAAQKINDLGFPISNAALKEGLLNTRWPGRFEMIDRFILEGAHNINGMQAAISTIEDYLLEEELTVVFGVMADKETEAMQNLIEPYAKRIVFTEVNIPRALSRDVLYERSTHPNKSKCEINSIINETSGTTLVIGSLYLVSAIRNQLI